MDTRAERLSYYDLLFQVWRQLLGRQSIVRTMLLVLLWTVCITYMNIHAYLSLCLYSFRLIHTSFYNEKIVPDNPSEPGEKQRIHLRGKLHLTDTQKTRILQLVHRLQRIEKRLMVSEWCITNFSTNVCIMVMIV